PSAMVPIVLTVPDELIGKVGELIHFWTDLDQHAIELRDEAIRRFALGMDLPPEIVLGMARSGASANHWTSWQIEESSIKVHAEPLLELITNAITLGYLTPATGDPNDVVTYDTTALKLRPDRSKEALELYDRGTIDAEALRRENGFDETDVPDEQESRDWLLRKVASGSTTPEQVEEALRALGVPLPAMIVSPSTEARPTPSLVGHPSKRQAPDTLDSPPQPRAPAASLAAAAEVLVYRALERAGNRLRNSTGKLPNVSAADTYLYVRPAAHNIDHLLADAWSCVPMVLDGLVADPGQVSRCLDTYCRGLLSQGQKHDRDTMLTFLATAVPA
ncbi:MAG TPA: hypothetical protein VGN81_26665, partial [Pseudonocardiaceae bacterium]